MKNLFIIIILYIISISCNTYKIPERPTQAMFAKKLYDSLEIFYLPLIKDSLEKSFKFHKIIPNEYPSIDEFWKDSASIRFIIVPRIFVNNNFFDENSTYSWFNSSCKKDTNFRCVILKDNKYWLTLWWSRLVDISDYKNFRTYFKEDSIRKKLNDFYTYTYSQEYDAIFQTYTFEKDILLVKNKRILLIGGNNYQIPDEYYKERDFKEYWDSKDIKSVIREIEIYNPCWKK